jgi:hypothetical protein
MGDALSPGGNSAASTHKRNSPFVQPKKETRLGIEPTTYGYICKFMITFHGGAGRLSRGIGHVHLCRSRTLAYMLFAGRRCAQKKNEVVDVDVSICNRRGLGLGVEASRVRV